MGVRKHYMTLCIRDNTEITHIEKSGIIEVTFEQDIPGGFKTLVLDMNANVITNVGFNLSEIAYFQKFLVQNRDGILMESRGEI